MNKDSLRELLKQKRQQLTDGFRGHAALAVADHFAKSALFLSSQNVAAYISTGYELDMRPTVKRLWESKKNVFLPSLFNVSGKEMQFKPYCEDTVLEENRYNILEPVTDEKIPASNLDIVLLPLLGFDLRGFRIGTGGGYYDATFAFLRAYPRPIKPQLIGVGFEQQCIERISQDNWDVPLDGVLTEERFLLF